MPCSSARASISVSPLGVAIGGLQAHVVAERRLQPRDLLRAAAVGAVERAGEPSCGVERQARADQAVGAQAAGERARRWTSGEAVTMTSRAPRSASAARHVRASGRSSAAARSRGEAPRLGLQLGSRHAGQEPPRGGGLEPPRSRSQQIARRRRGPAAPGRRRSARRPRARPGRPGSCRGRSGCRRNRRPRAAGRCVSAWRSLRGRLPSIRIGRR